MKTFTRLPFWAIELLIGYSILIGLNLWIVPESPAFQNTNPHPYLFLILLLACRYGLLSGIVGAMVGSLILAYWGGVIFKHEIWEDVQPATIQFLQFFGAAAIFGTVRNRYISEAAAIKEKLSVVEDTLEKLVRESRMYKKLNAELETRILTDIQTFANLYGISRNLERLDAKRICRSIPKILVDHLHAERCSLYLFDEEKLQLEASKGWTKDLNHRKTIPLDNSMLGQACLKKKALSIREFLDSPGSVEFLGESIMCAPLMDSNKQLLGAVNIESMPFLQVTSDSLTVFRVLSEWFSNALSNALYHERVQSHSIEDNLLEIYNRRYIEERLTEEFARSKLYYSPFSIALFRFEMDPSQTMHSRLDEIRFIISYLRLIRTETDIIASYSEEIPLALLMLTTNDGDAQKKIAEISRALNHLLHGDDVHDSRLKIGYASFEGNMGSWQQILRNAEEALCLN